MCPAVLFASLSNAHAQWTQEWSSALVDNNTIAGWVDFQQSGDTWTSRFYTLDSLAFRVMGSTYSQTPVYTYTFNNAERLANLNLYSLGVDLTGDGIVEFYVMSDYGTTSPYRQAFRIFNIVNNTVVFQRDDASYSYGYPTVWDADDDGMYECTFVRYDYLSGSGYDYEVFSTGVPLTARGGSPVPQQVDLRQNFPNPFNPSTRIEYSLASPARVQIDITNLMGQRVQTIQSGAQTPGIHSLLWDGRDRGGASIPSGTYFYQLLTNGQPQATRKMILVR
jgi:hypothetical protein